MAVSDLPPVSNAAAVNQNSPESLLRSPISLAIMSEASTLLDGKTTEQQYVRLGDLVTITIFRNWNKEALAAVDSSNKFWLFAEGYADESVYLERRGSITRVHQGIYRIDCPSSEVTERSLIFDPREPGYRPEPELSYGKPLLYGDQFRLKHTHSDKYLSLSKDLGWTVALVANNEIADSNCVVLPFTSEKYAGDLVVYSDWFLVSFPDAQVRQFLAMQRDQWDAADILCTSLKTSCLFQFSVYEKWQTGNASAVRYGSMLQLRHSELGAYLAGVNIEEEEKRQKQGRNPAFARLPTISSSEPWRAVLSYTDRSGSYWMLENQAFLLGGTVAKGDLYHLKHAVSEKYLCQDFALRSAPDPEFLIALKTPRRRDTIAELRLQDLVVVTTSRGNVIVPEAISTLEQFWQNMVVSCQSKMNAQVSRFEVKLTSTLSLGDTENQIFELRGLDKSVVSFFRKIQGFRETLSIARTALKSGKKPEYSSGFVYPRARKMVAEIRDSLRNEPNIYQLQAFQRVVMDLQIPHRLFKMLSIEGLDKAQPELSDLCQDTLELVCKNNTEVSSQIISAFQNKTLYIVTRVREKYDMLSKILLKVECEANLHNQLISVICHEDLSPALESLQSKTSLLRILTTLCRKAGTKGEETRESVYKSLYRDKPVITFRKKEEEAENAATDDGVELHIVLEDFVLKPDTNLHWLNYVVQTLVLMSELCIRQSDEKAQEMKDFVTERVGLNIKLLENIVDNQRLMYPIRTVCVKLRGVLYFRQPAEKEMMEWPLLHGCWLHDEIPNPSAQVQMFQRKDSIAPGDEPIEHAKFREFVFWMNKQVRESPKPSQMGEFLQYMQERLMSLKLMAMQGYVSDAYLAFLYQGLQDFAWAIAQVEKKTSHWFLLTIEEAMKSEGETGDLKQGLGKLFMKALDLAKTIYKILIRRKLLLTLYQLQPNAAAMSVAEFVDDVLRRWLEINSRNDDMDKCLIGHDDFQLSRNGTCKVYLEKVLPKRYDILHTLSELLLCDSPVPRYASDKLTEMLSRLHSEELKMSTSLASIQPMESQSYRSLRDTISLIQIDAAKGNAEFLTTGINKNLYMLWNTLELVKVEYPKLLHSFQKLLRKVGMGKSFEQLFAHYARKGTLKESHNISYIEDVTRMTLLIAQRYIDQNAKNMKEFIQLINWNHSFIGYREFAWLMKDLGLMEYISHKNLAVVITEALTTDRIKAKRITDFLALFMIDGAVELRRKYQLAIGKVLFKMLEDVTANKETVSHNYKKRSAKLQRWVFFKNPELKEIAKMIRGSALDPSDRTNRLEVSQSDISKLITPQQFSQIFGYEAIHPLPNNYDKTEDWQKMQRDLRSATEKAKSIEFVDHQIVKLVFASENWPVAMRKVLATASEQLKSGKNTRFLLNLLSGLVRRCQFLPSKDKTFLRTHNQMTPQSVLVALFWDCEIVEIAYRISLRETDVYIQAAALSTLELLHQLEVPSHRTRLVTFMRRDESLYDFFAAFEATLTKYEIILAHSHKMTQIETQPSADESIFSDNSLNRVSGLMLKIMELSNPDLKYHPRYRALYRRTVSLYLSVIMHCSDVCYMEFQDLMREQSSAEGATNMNMIVFLAEFVYEFSRLHEDMLKEEMVVVTGAMVALTEAVSGPNSLNQNLVLENEKFAIGIKNLLRTTKKYLVQQPDGRLVPTHIVNCHAAILALMLALLEGEFVFISAFSSSQKHPKQIMAEKLEDSSLLLDGLKEMYREFVQGREKYVRLEVPNMGLDYKVINLAIQQCILVLRLGAVLGKKTLKVKASEFPPAALSFYTDYIGYVEIQRDGAIIDLLFQVPYKAKYLTKLSAESLILEAKRTSQKDKVDSFVKKVEVLMEEMMHQIKISRYAVKTLSKYWKLYGTLSFVLICAINILLLYFVTGYEDSKFQISPTWINDIILALGIGQSIFKLASITCYLFEYWPTIRMLLKETRGYYLLPSFTTRRSFFVYSYAYIMISFTAIRYFQFYPLLLLEIMYQAERLTTILKAVTLNLSQLLLTTLFAVLMVYIFSAYSLMFFAKYYKANESMLCDNLQTCFSTTLNHGIRIGGGIGEVMKYPSIEDYYARMVFDLLFFVVVIIVSLNILFGIIIDTFGELRDKKRELEEDMNNICFICGENRSLIDVKGEGWTKHTQKYHNPSNYFAFLVHIKDLPKKDCNGLEKYVKELQEKYDSKFIPPTSKAIRLKS